MSLHFDQPMMLLLGLLALPMVYVGWRSIFFDPVRRFTILPLRALLLLAMVFLMAGPYLRREHDHLTVIGLLDISGSVQRFAQLPPLDGDEGLSYIQHLRHWFREHTKTKGPDDRFGLVVFDGEAIAISAPRRGKHIDDNLDLRTVAGTNIADAIRLGLALFPPDMARRLILVTDGNETVGDAMEAARQAASSARSAKGEAAAPASAVPIDVVPIAYLVTNDVQILRVEAPATAQPGQTVSVRIVLEATEPTTGRLTLRREGIAVDLNGAKPGHSRRMALPAGQSVHTVAVELDEKPVNRFEAFFEPDEEDALPVNNRGETFVATPGKGRVLIVDRDARDRENLLLAILEEANVPALAEVPEAVPMDLLSLQNYDLIVLDDIAAFELPPEQHELLSRYVNDLGGGLIMIGGEDSFGAGGWNGTAIEEILPLELDPPKELRLPQAALVIVLDTSGSMRRHVAGARRSQQEVANEASAIAIESLRGETLVGVVTFNAEAHEYIPLQRKDDGAEIARRVRGITAGGGTNIEPALRLALRMLRDVDADRRRIVCLTDGQSPTHNLPKIAETMNAEGIQLSTIAIGDDADHEMLARLARIGGGEFYPVYNPNALPRVLVDSVQVINKPLIKEGPFTPVVRPTGSTLTLGMDAAPPLGGLVVTAPRDTPLAVIEMTHPDGEPLLAHWQVGVGRVTAFTSDLGGRWSRSWSGWDEAASFWTQLVRSTARPAMSHDAELLTAFAEGRLEITLEASDDEEGFLDYLQVEGTVYTPGGGAVPVRLRQTAPGYYETSIAARAAGNYIVALNPRRGRRQLAPVIGGASRTTGEEFRRYESNIAMLHEIVELTGGRHLGLGGEAVDLFDRSGMPRTVSLLPAGRTLLWVVIALLLLDVASRRIAWSGPGVRAALALAVGRVTPASVRGREAAATLASLREVSAQIEDRRQADAKGVEELVAKKPEERTARAAPEAPVPSKVAAALGILTGRTKLRDHDKPAPLEDVPKDTAADSTKTTSGLLAAKQRARKRMDG